MKKVKRGDIYYIAPTGAILGSEQGGYRPAVILSNNANNQFSPTVEIAYLTKQEKHEIPTHVPISSSIYESTGLCEQIMTVDKRRLRGYIGHCTEEELEGLDDACMVSLDLKGTGTMVKKYRKKIAELEKKLDKRQGEKKNVHVRDAELDIANRALLISYCIETDGQIQTCSVSLVKVLKLLRKHEKDLNLYEIMTKYLSGIGKKVSKVNGLMLKTIFEDFRSAMDIEEKKPLSATENAVLVRLFREKKYKV